VTQASESQLSGACATCVAHFQRCRNPVAHARTLWCLVPTVASSSAASSARIVDVKLRGRKAEPAVFQVKVAKAASRTEAAEVAAEGDSPSAAAAVVQVERRYAGEHQLYGDLGAVKATDARLPGLYDSITAVPEQIVRQADVIYEHHERDGDSLASDGPDLDDGPLTGGRPMARADGSVDGNKQMPGPTSPKPFVGEQETRNSFLVCSRGTVKVLLPPPPPGNTGWFFPLLKGHHCVVVVLSCRNCALARILCTSAARPLPALVVPGCFLSGTRCLESPTAPLGAAVCVCVWWGVGVARVIDAFVFVSCSMVWGSTWAWPNACARHAGSEDQGVTFEARVEVEYNAAAVSGNDLQDMALAVSSWLEELLAAAQSQAQPRVAHGLRPTQPWHLGPTPIVLEVEHEFRV
jgi:hypothetical protein